jgi:hypothetical protein
MRYIAAAVLLCLAAPAFAQDAPPPVAPVVAAPPAPVVQVSAADLAALVKAAAAQPATVAPAKAPMVGEDGALGFSWAQILSGLGNLLLLLFAAFKGPEWIKARKTLQAAAETGWLVSERLSQIYGLKGADKARQALGEFLRVYSEGGIAVPPGAVAEAERIFAAKSAQAGLAVAPAPVDPAALAKARADAAVAAAPGTATDLADRAAR